MCIFFGITVPTAINLRKSLRCIRILLYKKGWVVGRFQNLLWYCGSDTGRDRLGDTHTTLHTKPVLSNLAPPSRRLFLTSSLTDLPIVEWGSIHEDVSAVAFQYHRQSTPRHRAAVEEWGANLATVVV